MLVPSRLGPIESEARFESVSMNSNGSPIATFGFSYGKGFGFEDSLDVGYQEIMSTLVGPDEVTNSAVPPNN